MLYVSLALLLAVSFVLPNERKNLTSRSLSDWLIDGGSLITHFLVLPIAQVFIVYRLYAFILPEFKGTVSLGWVAAIGANMVVDYAWYWNHRLFHAQGPLWNLHAVHHEPKKLDILASSRNTLWSPMVMVYFWLQPLAIFLAQDPAPFLTVAGVGLLINFWGHTNLNLPRNSVLRKIASTFLIQPEDHFWHHSAQNTYCNFATVFNFWDKLHGTWHQPHQAPGKLGFELKLPTWKKLSFPF